MRASRTRVVVVALCVVLAATVLAAVGGSRSTPKAAPAWPGQLSTAPAAPAGLTTTGVVLHRDSATLAGWSAGDVDRAWARARQVTEALGAGRAVVDPSRELTAADLTTAGRPYLSDSARASLTALAPAALNQDPAAQQALRPLLFWYDRRDEDSGAVLRLAARPYGPYVLRAAAVTGAQSGARRALVFSIDTELTLNLVDRTGGENHLFLTRTLNVALVPTGSGQFAVDGWSGSFEVIKPVGQVLPAQPQDAKRFAPTQP